MCTTAHAGRTSQQNLCQRHGGRMQQKQGGALYSRVALSPPSRLPSAPPDTAPAGRRRLRRRGRPATRPGRLPATSPRRRRRSIPRTRGQKPAEPPAARLRSTSHRPAAARWLLCRVRSHGPFRLEPSETLWRWMSPPADGCPTLTALRCFPPTVPWPSLSRRTRLSGPPVTLRFQPVLWVAMAGRRSELARCGLETEQALVLVHWYAALGHKPSHLYL